MSYFYFVGHEVVGHLSRDLCSDIIHHGCPKTISSEGEILQDNQGNLYKNLYVLIIIMSDIAQIVFSE